MLSDNNNRGGKRIGAGRKTSGRTQRTLRATDVEWELIKIYMQKIREGSHNG